ncbi:MAG: hypothetical protein HYY24_18010 [Verrucomicrobia bacterium]|nr:hypothetical protein [Verrucomicrobiota bacterium]
MRTNNQFAAPPRNRSELLAIHKRLLKKVRAMSSDQLFATMVRAGIYTKSGKLRKEYGG